MNSNLSIQHYLKQPEVNKRIGELLKERASEFIINVSSMVNNNELLAKCEPKSLMMTALTATAMNIPINQNLGMAFIIPYRQKDGSYVAQFQLGFKGYIQLAMRSSQFQTINVSDVKEGELQGFNRLTGEMQFTWIETDREKAKTVGYIAYFKLINGFEKSLYMTVDEVTAHGKQYSQSMRKGYGLWVDQFDAMAKKTVLKLLLSKYAPMNTDMQKAIQVDQAVITEEGEAYVDNLKQTNEEIAREKEIVRLKAHLIQATNLEEVMEVEPHIAEYADTSLNKLYEQKREELTK